jgi:hypothetical protein
VPLFTYTISQDAETRTTQLRKSNPQGWLPQAVIATFPEVASRRAHDIWQIRLEPVEGARQTWRARLHDEPADLVIVVTQTKK